MTGVTILDTIEIYSLSWWQFIFGLAPLIICAVICFVRMYKAFKKGTKEEQAMGAVSTEHWNPKEMLLIFLGSILSFALMICLDNFCPADYVETHYKVTASETASLIEFHNKYNIIEEHTDYFIVTEKSK